MVASLFLVDLPAWAQTGGFVLALVIAVIGGLLAAAAWERERMRPFLARHRMLGWLQVVADDLAIIGRSRQLPRAFLLSLPYLLAQTLPIYFVCLGYGLNVTALEAFAMMIVLRLSAAVPQAPGNLGLYNLIAKQLLVGFGVEAALATRVSAVMWSLVTLPLLFAGFVALAMSGARILELQRDAEASMADHASHRPGTSGPHGE